jgi:hypothetical protein
MDFLSFLLAKMQALSIYFAWMYKSSGRRKLHDYISSADSHPSQQFEAVPKPARKPARKQTRLIEWISIGEFMMVLEKCRNLLVIDLRAHHQVVQFPVPKATVLRVSPNELVNVLEWLPADRTLVFCGASNLSTAMIESTPCMQGSAPVYALQGDLPLLEVA